MLQKNDWPQNHQQGESQQAVSTLKCLNTKFIHSLNGPTLHPPCNFQKTNWGTIEARSNNRQSQGSRNNISTVTMLDDQDFLFLEEFQSQESKSSTFSLAPNHHPLHYTESEVLNNEQTTSSLCNEESIFEQTHHSHAHPLPRTPINAPPNILQKESEVKFGNGGMFRGEMKDGKMANGTFVLDSMFSYRGGILNDKFHGQGALTFQNGHTVTCNWHQGRPAGHVTIQYPRGQRYEGELLDFKKHGIGCLYFKDGSRYVGQFQRGEITGQGCYYSASSEEKRGFWKDGQFQGHIATGENQQPTGEAPRSRGSGVREQQRLVARIK